MLLLAAFFWGTTFAAQSTAADSIPLFTFNAARSFVGAAFLGILILIRQGSRKGKAGSDSGVGQKRGAVSGGKRQESEVCGGKRQEGEVFGGKRQESEVCGGKRQEGEVFGGKRQECEVCGGKRQEGEVFGGKRQGGAVFGGSICGVVLFAAMSFQQGGITAYPEGAAASGRSGFLTATYVVMVAVCARFLGKKLHKSVYAAVAVCIVGMYLLCMAGGVGEIYFGDALGLICAVFFTVHILVVDHFSYCESIRLSCMQFLVCGILSTVAMLLFEQPDLHMLPGMLLAAAGPILYAGILSSGIAFTLQMEGQKYAEPSVAAVIMSLESVFAVLGGWIVLGERLSARELAGCALVFAAVILAQLPHKEQDQGSAVV